MQGKIMSKVRLKYAITEIDETLHEVEPRISHQEERITTKRPHMPCGKSSEAQKAHRQLFKQAAAYAKAALADPEVRARYEELARQQGKLPRGTAIADYLKGNDVLSKR
jgi:hypothetical protein